MAAFSICLVKVSLAFEYASSSKCQCSEYGKIVNIQGLHRVLNMLWKCLNMCEYTLIMLNMLEYTWIYLNKQSSEYARLVNVSDAVRSIRSLYKLLSSYRDRGVFRRLSNIKNGAFCKKNNTWVQPHNQEVFSASEVSWN